MALFYLWFLDAVGLTRTPLVGHDIGGWLAADMATACPHVVDRLVLVAAMGLKPQHSEIRDIFLITSAEVWAKSFFGSCLKGVDVLSSMRVSEVEHSQRDRGAS